MEKQKFTLKTDRYRKARGGYSRFLNIYCSQCRHHVLLYQKDGPGPLKRAYIDRILAPKSLTGAALRCSACQSILGKAYMYEKEQRAAFLLDPHSFIKKIGKGIYPPVVTKIQ